MSADEVLREPDDALAVADHGEPDLGEAAVQQVLAVTVVRRLLGQHAVGEAVRRADLGAVARSGRAEADVLARCPERHTLVAEPVQALLAGALVAQAAAVD